MGKKIHYFDSNNEEWLALRREYLTSTDIASLFQLGSKSIAKVIEDKINPPEPIRNEFMTIGNILEPAVLNSFRLRMGIAVEPAAVKGIVMVCDEDLRIAATPDGKYFDGTKWHLIECKTAGSADLDKARENFRKWKNGVPDHYLIQVHVQMITTGISNAYIGCMSYFFPVPFIAYQVTYDERVATLIIDEVNRYWECHDLSAPFLINFSLKSKLRALLSSSASLVYLSHDV